MVNEYLTEEESAIRLLQRSLARSEELRKAAERDLQEFKELLKLDNGAVVEFTSPVKVGCPVRTIVNDLARESPVRGVVRAHLQVPAVSRPTHSPLIERILRDIEERLDPFCGSTEDELSDLKTALWEAEDVLCRGKEARAALLRVAILGVGLLACYDEKYPPVEFGPEAKTSEGFAPGVVEIVRLHRQFAKEVGNG